MPDAPVGTGLILGIESSCDETAAAVVRRGTETLSNVVASQIALHAEFGGVVPELASREHLRNIVPVVRAAIAEAGLRLEDLEAIAVTRGPGLAGALLVGITYAKTLAFGLGKPLIAINHLEGHIHAVLMDHAAHLSGTSTAPSFFAEPERTTGTPSSPAVSPPERVGSSGPFSGSLQTPILALVVSGGHTHLYLAHQQPSSQDSSLMVWEFRNIGRTVDDAAGEAFDKVAKLLGLGYPGGPWIDSLASHGDPRAVSFTFSPIKYRLHLPQIAPTQAAVISTEPARLRIGETPVFAPAHISAGPRFDFSFSGIKTGVLRYTQAHHMQSAIEQRRPLTHPLAPTAETIADLIANCLLDPQTLDLLASFQHAVVGNLLKQTFAAARHFNARAILVCGGVAANSELRRRFTAEADRRQLPMAFPSLALSTDNAAMIAAAAWPRLLAQDFASDDLTATPQLRLG